MQFGKKKLLYVTHINPCGSDAGNKYRILNILHMLKDQYDVNILYLSNIVEESEDLFALGNIGKVWVLDARTDHVYTSNVNTSRDIRKVEGEAFPIFEGAFPTRHLATAHDVLDKFKPDIIFCNYIHTWRILTQIPVGLNPISIVDTHDVMSDRSVEYNKSCTHFSEHCLSRKVELNILNQFNYVIAISDRDVNSIEALNIKGKVLYLPPIVKTNKLSSPDNFTILIVASNNPYNNTGIDTFLKITFPLILREIPTARLRVVGNVVLSGQYSLENVDIVGFAPSLDAEYQNAAIVVNPVPYGTGIKIKTIEAMGYARAVVGYKESFAGIPIGDQYYANLVATSAVDLAHKICRVLQNYNLLQEASINCYEIAACKFGNQISYSDVLSKCI